MKNYYVKNFVVSTSSQYNHLTIILASEKTWYNRIGSLNRFGNKTSFITPPSFSTLLRVSTEYGTKMYPLVQVRKIVAGRWIVPIEIQKLDIQRSSYQESVLGRLLYLIYLSDMSVCDSLLRMLQIFRILSQKI